MFTQYPLKSGIMILNTSCAAPIYILDSNACVVLTTKFEISYSWLTLHSCTFVWFLFYTDNFKSTLYVMGCCGEMWSCIVIYIILLVIWKCFHEKKFLINCLIYFLPSCSSEKALPSINLDGVQLMSSSRKMFC